MQRAERGRVAVGDADPDDVDGRALVWGVGEQAGGGVDRESKARHGLIVKSFVPPEGAVTRARLGAAIEPLTPKIASELGIKATEGAVVREILPDGPAAKSGLKKDDVIVGVDGARRPLTESGLIGFLLRNKMPGDRVSFAVLRGDSRLNIELPMQ